MIRIKNRGGRESEKHREPVNISSYSENVSRG